MNVSQNQTYAPVATASVSFLQLFKSSHFMVLSLVLVLTFTAVAWLQKQAMDRASLASYNQKKAIIEFTQDALTLRSISQDMSKLVFDIKQAMQSLDRQQVTFLDSNQFFLMNSIYQEASYAQSLVIKTFEMMAQLDAAISLANEHARQYQTQSAASGAHIEHIQSIQNHADTLGRAFYKLSWKYDELTTSITRTLQFTRYNGFAAGENHYSSIGAQKTVALENSIFWAGSKLVDMKVAVDETMGVVNQTLANTATPAAPSMMSKANQWSLLSLFVGFVAVALIWFYGVTKPKAYLAKSADSLSNSNPSSELRVLANGTGEWGTIAKALEQIAKRQGTLVAQHSQKTNELEQLKLSLLANPYTPNSEITSDELVFDHVVMADTLSKQESLPGFEQQPYRLN